MLIFIVIFCLNTDIFSNFRSFVLKGDKIVLLKKSN